DVFYILFNFCVLIDLCFHFLEAIDFFCVCQHIRKFMCSIHNLFTCIFNHIYFTPTVFSIMTPSKDHVLASVILTSTIDPIAALAPLQLTSLFLSVYPASTSGSFLLSPSTRTFTVLS